MPVDVSKPAGSDRRRMPRRDQESSARDGNYAREIESKRNRGEISCAECRRLKIKCDKQIPCQSCQRRGCAALCPNGSLATGQGTRFVIAATEHLHRRISRMSDRIRQLEDALAVLQSTHSQEQHPLLRESMTVLDQDKSEDPQIEQEDGEAPGEVVTAFGTMSISEHGVSRFFGPTGGSEGLLLYDGEDATASPGSSHQTDSTRDSRSPAIPSEAARFSHAFPFTPVGPSETVFALIQSQLPPWEEALRTSEVYLQNASWLFRSMTRTQLMDEMLPIMYRKKPAVAPDDYSGPHDLALLLYVFAVGRIVDLDLSHTEAEAQGEHFHQLAQAALCLQPVLERPSLITIQALHVGSIYNAMCGSEVSGGESTMETTWSLVALAAHLAQTIGLHRDSARWESSPKIVQHRRMLFWDLFVADSWHTLSTGRPPAFSRAYIDCQFPQDDEVTMSREGDAEPGFGSWGFRFAFECVSEVAAKTLTATSPRYSDIIDLDRKIREFSIPSDALAKLGGGPGVDPRSVPLAASMTSFVLKHTREVMLLFVHRSYFAQALIEEPVNPLRSPYAPSFLATVRAAGDVLRCVAEQFLIHPDMCSRFWSTWTYAFSAAVVFGVIVTRGPRSHLAESAMGELDRACDLFTQAAKYNRRAAKARTILMRLQDKAHRTLAAAKSSEGAQSTEDGAAWDIKQEEIDDELNIFAGRTKILRPAGPFSHPHQSNSPATKSDSVTHSAVRDDMDFTEPGSSSSASMQTSFAVRALDPSLEMTRDWLQELEHQPPAHPHPAVYHPLAPEYFQPPPLIATSRYGPITSAHPNPMVGPAPPGRRESFPSLSHHMQPQPYGSYNPAIGPPAAMPPLPPPHEHQHYAGAYQQMDGVQYGYAPPSELAGLGLAPSSSLNQNWTSLMHRSGILDGSNM